MKMFTCTYAADLGAIFLISNSDSLSSMIYSFGQVLDKDTCMYAVSQGAMAVECRNNDPFTLSLLSQIHDPETVIQCVAERAFLKKLVCTEFELLPVIPISGSY